MRSYVPRFLTLWVADVVLRLIHLTNGGKLLEVAKDRNFLWDGWRDKVLGVIMVRKLRSPRWSKTKIFENTATTTDGYEYKFYDIEE